MTLALPGAGASLLLGLGLLALAALSDAPKPAEEANPSRPSRLYRLVHAADAPLDDFLSDEARGRTKRPEQHQDDRLYRGVSMYSSSQTARDIQRRYPRLGPWIASLDLPKAGYVEVHKTRGRDHYTVIGLPRILKQFVTAVVGMR
ncbi:MAG TPA: hypothetical protein VMW62_09175 [Chloroflexota bacterium]|nr:hypothetical protein [Chloroflexota bacterium]